MRSFGQILKENSIIIGIIFVLSIPILSPLFHSGFLVTDDGDLLVIRLTAFHQAITLHQFPPRFLPRLNFQYGYPVADFLYPGYLYIGELIHIIHFGFINTIKILLGLSLFASAVWTYYWLRKFFSIYASGIGALIYLYTPYHFYDVYKRGSVGEVLALAVVPFIFWAIEKRLWSFIILGISLLILSHNTLAVLFIPLILLYYCIRLEVWKKKKEMVKMGAVFFVSLLVSAFFWIPALYDLQYTVFSQTKVSDITGYFHLSEAHFFNSISIFFIACFVIFALIFFQVFKKLEKNMRILTITFFGVGIIPFLLNTGVSIVIWKYLPLSFIQFPFRLLSLSMLAVAFIGALLVEHIKKKKKYVLGMLVFVIFCFPVVFLIPAISYTTKDDMYYVTNEDSTTVRNEYLPIWVKERVYTRPETVIASTNAILARQDHGRYHITMKNQAGGNVVVNMVYFPGWMAYGDGKRLPVTYTSPKGLVQISVPKNVRQIVLFFGETPVRLVSDGLSVLGVLFLCFIFVKDVKLIYAENKK